ncbi:TniQ family protein [Aureimonas sp. Leaf324]|uniref:TniQ family protein n=1 Tax=Aureimonas sp. Leaf324 TaxID=1736336 RepID=UPI0006F4F0B2|nr:TniQ family protein [Aureimonas sp. Leaf324]KQQ85698.1 hypothetical protein ASF65_03880 [Aureimonas sp. Leaf324]
MLPFELDVGEAETPSDYLSRRSVLACRDESAEFCLDFGLDFQGIVDGVPAAIETLASMAGIEAATLHENAFVRVGSSRSFVHRGERLGRHHLMRDRIRVCPRCMAEDLERLGCRPAARPHRRAAWIVEAIRCCDLHGVGLVALPFDPETDRRHDTSPRFAEAIPRLPQLLAKCRERPVRALEGYVRSRLRGVAASGWIDALPLYVVIDLSFLVGIVETLGPGIGGRELTGNERVGCEEVGMGIIEGGEASFREFLERRQRKFHDTRTAWGPKSMFGRLYERLAHETDDDAYEPVRELMMDHMNASLPVGPADRAFGRPFPERKVQSIYEAARENRLHPKRLRTFLGEVGLIDRGQKKSDDRTLFSADRAAPLLRGLRDAMDLQGVAKYLGIPRPHVRPLIEMKYVKVIPESESDKFRTWSIERREADAFMTRMLDQADRTIALDGLYHLPAAAKRTCRSTGEILQLLFGGKLTRVGIDPDVRGYLSVLVDPEEIKTLLAPRAEGIVTLRAVEQELRTSTVVVKKLVDRGHLRARTIVNPVMRRPQTIVDRDELDQFKRSYVSLNTLADDRGRHFRRLARELREAGIAPIDDPKVLEITLYRRIDVI